MKSEDILQTLNCQSMILKIVLSFGLIWQVFSLFAQEWKLSKSNEHIKVYTAKASASKFDMIKVEAFVDGTLQKLINILRDVGNNKKWVYKTKRSYMIDSLSPSEFLYYAETGVPWPFSNRDMVIRMQFMLDSMNNTLQVQATGVPHAIAEKKGLVRISKFDGLWQVKQETNKKLTINYLLKIDPGGSIPAGVSNLFLSNGPYETFNNLAKLLMQ